MYQTKIEPDIAMLFGLNQKEHVKSQIFNSPNHITLETQFSKETFSEEDIDMNELRISKKLPNVENTMHYIKNTGHYYVQESLHKSHSPVHKMQLKEVIKCKVFKPKLKFLSLARDIFMDESGKINTRAALEASKNELGRSIMYLLKYKRSLYGGFRGFSTILRV